MESDSEWAGFDTDTNAGTNASSTDDSEEEWSGISNTDDDAAAASSDPPIAMTLASPPAAQYDSYEELLDSKCLCKGSRLCNCLPAYAEDKARQR